jgi:hypothetical protein
MKLVAVICTSEKLGSIRDFVVRQLESHFQEWSSHDRGSEYSLRWCKKTLILETNSNYILASWLKVEKQYLEYLLDENQFTDSKQIEAMIAAELKYLEEEFYTAA